MPSRKPNPRLVATPLEGDAARLYEEVYCARGEMEKRIKEQQLSLFADRTSAATMQANQLRLWFSSVACVSLAEGCPRKAIFLRAHKNRSGSPN
jgi:hypothetical protein